MTLGERGTKSLGDGETNSSFPEMAASALLRVMGRPSPHMQRYGKYIQRNSAEGSAMKKRPAPLPITQRMKHMANNANSVRGNHVALCSRRKASANAWPRTAPTKRRNAAQLFLIRQSTSCLVIQRRLSQNAPAAATKAIWYLISRMSKKKTTRFGSIGFNPSHGDLFARPSQGVSCFLR
jgi:hypothetical protein